MPEEIKLVTILFADVTGSTELGEFLDPEDVRALMGRYYAHAQRVIQEHGGTLEKFIGDAVMAVFGLPRAHGNDAERALAAALVLREAIATDKLLGGRLLLRMGVNTGEVVATSELSGGDFLVTGDAVNVAARLQQAASPGEIVVGERTVSVAQNAFLFSKVRLIEVKGKRKPLSVFPLIEERTVRLVGRPPLIGRQQDLLQLNLLGMRALEERRPQLVSIVAPAGTGKTRLLEEFLAHLDAADRFQVATARCLPYGQMLTYWPLRGLLTDLLGDEIGKQLVANAFVRGGLTAEDAGRLADLVLATLGIEHEEAIDRESIFAAWRLLVEILVHQTARIVVFEDLHWASESLLDLVEYLMHLRTQASLLIIVLSRPELLNRRPMWGGGRRNFNAIALEPLSDAQTWELVEYLTKKGGGLHDSTRELIVQRSGGNPFFAIELVRGLTERGLERGNVPTSDTLPDTVYEATLARLDLLTAGERTVLQVASVAGRTFRAATLYAVLDTFEPNELEFTLEKLLAQDLIVRGEGGTFTFGHILIRDVAYGTLSRAERVRLHGKIASWIELFAADRLDEFTELIAYHYRETVMLARQSAIPLSLPIDPSRAVYYLERAGLLASRSGAFAEALIYLQSAITIAPEEEHLRLYEQLGDAVSNSDTAIEAYRKARECWLRTAERDPLIGLQLLRKLLIESLRLHAWYETERVKKEESAELLTEAQRLIEVADNEDERWRVNIADLLWQFRWGDITRKEVNEGRGVCMAAAAHFEAQENWVALSESLDTFTFLSWMVDAWDDALVASRRRRRIPELPAMERGDAVYMMAGTYFCQGNYSRCSEIVREALEQLRPGESAMHLLEPVVRATYSLYLSGNWTEMNEYMPILEELWEQVQYDASKATYLAMGGMSGGYLGVLNVALARKDRALADAASSVIERGLPIGDTNARSLLAALREDDPNMITLNPPNEHFEGNQAAIPIIMFLSEHGIHAPQALIEGLLSWLSWYTWWYTNVVIRCVEIAQALAVEDHARLAKAIDEAETHGLIPHAARMRIVLAQRTSDQTQLERARPVLERLGDRRSLRRLEEIEAIIDEMGR
jgi:class 3 adenylate cyclase/tetratricopeptide (TPR) repeat protein